MEVLHSSQRVKIRESYRNRSHYLCIEQRYGDPYVGDPIFLSSFENKLGRSGRADSQGRDHQPFDTTEQREFWFQILTTDSLCSRDPRRHCTPTFKKLSRYMILVYKTAFVKLSSILGGDPVGIPMGSRWLPWVYD